MRTSKIILGLFFLTILTAINGFAQQEFTLNATPANITASRVQIDNPDLTGNPQAIIIATPVGNTAVINKHPLGAWYYNNKWNIFNTDHANMAIGATFKVQYFLQSGSNQFLHIITNQNAGERSYIDNPLLNNKPTVPVRIFQNHAPNNRTAGLNPFEARISYDTNAGKWYIQNVSLKMLYANTAYNIVIDNPQTSSPTPPNPTPPSTTPTPANPKPSVLVFNQNDDQLLLDSNRRVSIPGLNNQTFTLTQSSRVVFHTIVQISNVGGDPSNPQISQTISLGVRILNSANTQVAVSITQQWVEKYTYQTLLSSGIGILPAGTYHTNVATFGDNQSSRYSINSAPYNEQGSQLIIEIFPD